MQDGDFTLVSSPSECDEVSMDVVYIQKQNYSYQHGGFKDHHLDNKKCIQVQTEVLMPAIRLFSSTVSPPSSPLPSPPPPTGISEHVQCDSGIDMYLSRENSVNVEEEDMSVSRMAAAERQFKREMQTKDEEIASLRVQVAELERQRYMKNTDLAS